MDEIDSHMIAAWQQAATDLGIRLTSPFSVRDQDGRSVNVEGFLPDFGRPDGIIFISAARSIVLKKTDRQHSTLFTAYRVYERSLFVDTLEDWGWFGPSDPPPWYVGKGYMRQ
jgi:hypothetical protein